MLTASKGATEAKDEWEDLHQDELVQGKKAPSKKFFKRQKRKFVRYGTVENREKSGMYTVGVSPNLRSQWRLV